MQRFSVFGESIDLPAVAAGRSPSFDESAWLHKSYLTVMLTDRVHALRVHTNGKSYPGRPKSDEAGKWLLLGDVIETSSQIASGRSLPSQHPRSHVAFTHVSEAIALPGVVLNLGLASAKFGESVAAFKRSMSEAPDSYSL